jgi:hypothetical protein
MRRMTLMRRAYLAHVPRMCGAYQFPDEPLRYEMTSAETLGVGTIPWSVAPSKALKWRVW